MEDILSSAVPCNMNYSDPRRVPATNPLPSDDNEMRTRRVNFHQDVHPTICWDDLRRTHSSIATACIEEQTEQTRALPSRYMYQQDVNKRDNSDTRISFAYPPYTHHTAPTHTQVPTVAASTCIDDQRSRSFCALNIDGGDNSNIPPAHTQSPFSDTTDPTYFASDQVDEAPMAKSEKAKKNSNKKAKKKTKKRKSSTCKPKSSSSHLESFKMQHDYHDYSRTSFERYKECHPNMKRPRLMKCMAPFPRALHNILEDASTESIISWCPHGRAFKIHDKNAFVNEIMPRHFSQSKFTSFQRQLNIYSFRRLTKGPDTDGYYHELFLRARVDLCQAMCRHKIKGTIHKGSSNPHDEPHFYALPFVDSSTVVDDSTDEEIDADADADADADNDSATKTTGAAVSAIAHTERIGQPEHAVFDPGCPRTPYNKKPTFTYSTSSIVTPPSPSSKTPGSHDTLSELERMLVRSDASVGAISLPSHVEFSQHEEAAAAPTYAKILSCCNNEAYDLTLPFNTQDLEQDLLQLPLIEEVSREIMSSEEKVGENETFQDFDW